MRLVLEILLHVRSIDFPAVHAGHHVATHLWLTAGQGRQEKGSRHRRQDVDRVRVSSQRDSPKLILLALRGDRRLSPQHDERLTQSTEIIWKLAPRPLPRELERAARCPLARDLAQSGV